MKKESSDFESITLGPVQELQPRLHANPRTLMHAKKRRGMMTAEQFYDDVWQGDNGCHIWPVFKDACAFAEAYAAAQLAEKEREITRLERDLDADDLDMHTIASEAGTSDATSWRHRQTCPGEEMSTTDITYREGLMLRALAAILKGVLFTQFQSSRDEANALVKEIETELAGETQGEVVEP